MAGQLIDEDDGHTPRMAQLEKQHRKDMEGLDKTPWSWNCKQLVLTKSTRDHCSWFNCFAIINRSLTPHRDVQLSFGCIA